MRIIYFDIDCLRPDHLGCYGYHRPTSPNIDAIAADGARFDHCYCASSPCLPSRAAWSSGRFGIRNGVCSNHTLLYGVEVKFYSNRLELTPALETQIRGLYACGDGAGITRGLVQASASGLLAARAILGGGETGAAAVARLPRRGPVGQRSA